MTLHDANKERVNLNMVTLRQPERRPLLPVVETSGGGTSGYMNDVNPGRQSLSTDVSFLKTESDVIQKSILSP